MSAESHLSAQNPVNAHSETTTLDTYVNAAWVCAHISLWTADLFSIEATRRIQKQIRHYLLQGADTYSTYINFCERVLLARHYVNSSPDRFIPHPFTWLSIDSEYGFNGTFQWHTQLLEKRRANPLHRLEWKALAEAILEIVEDGPRHNYQYWCGYFSERNQFGMLALFKQAVAEAIFVDAALAEMTQTHTQQSKR